MTAHWRKRLIGFTTLFTVLVCLGSYADAGGFDHEDFSLRFPAALTRFSSYADVAAVGGACAGSKWQSSVNPASTDWQSLHGRYHVSLNPQYSAILFNEGTVLHVISESVTKNFNQFGSLIFALAQIRSNDDETRQDLEFSIDMDYLQIQWGKRFSEDFALGLNFNYATSDITNKYNGLKVAYSSSDSYGYRAGALYRIADNLLGGLVLEYSQSPGTTTYYDVFGLGIGDVRVKDRTKQYVIRVGPQYEYKKDSTITVDYQYGYFDNDTGDMNVHRLFAGIDHAVMEALFVRGGFSLDNHGNASFATGIGIYPSKVIAVDVGYQYDMFPEIGPEFGDSHLLTISIGIGL